MKRLISLIIAMAASSAFAFGDVSYGNATANGGAAFGGSADTTGGNISSSIGGSAAANNIGGSATGNTGNVNGNVQTLTGNSANVTGGNVTGGSANVTAGSANVSGGNIKGGDQTNNLNGSVKGGNITSGINGSSLQGQSQDASNRQAQSSESRGNSTNTEVNVQGDNVTYEAQKRDPVSTAYAAPIAPTAVCALGVSGGVQTIGFGATFGNSYTDENCVLLEQVRTVSTVLSDKATATEMMCGLESYRAARKRMGNPCIEDKKAESANEPSDPFIRRRLGMAKVD